MKKVLITGGTVFVSRYLAEYYVAKDYEVYVLNRNTRKQSDGVTLIEPDRHALGEALRGLSFDVVIDTAYSARDVDLLMEALEHYGQYVLISSSADYPEYAPQPFCEDTVLGHNRYWGKYGTDKIEAEEALLKRDPGAYVIRPPYLYGPMNNVYREAFVFDCALEGRAFYLPKDGEMKLQFFHIHDLCRLIDALLERKPSQHIFNAGNRDAVSVRDWVTLCYRAAGRDPMFRNVPAQVEQRNYFSFYDYEYCLDVSRQCELLDALKPLEIGLKESFDWYLQNRDQVVKKPLIEYIDRHLTGKES